MMLILLGTLTAALIALAVRQGIRNRRRFKPLMAAAVERYRRERLITAGEHLIPVAELRAIRSEHGRILYTLRDGSEITLSHSVAGPVELAVLKDMGVDTKRIFTPLSDPVLWRPHE